MQEQSVQHIPVSKILPDENQPRKYFAADKMYNLKMSVKKHGIKVPLTVEDMGGESGRFLLIDGERRYRAAIELGLKTVPCVVEAPKSEADRLIEQFSIQEQHEAWTPVEKAMAILNLSKIVERSLKDVCEMLDIDSRTAGRYIAFAELTDKESFVKNEVPLDFAISFRNLRTLSRSLSEKEMEQDFTRADEKKLEHQLTKMIVRGDIQKNSDLTKISDSFKKNPKLIEKFLTKDNITPTALFLEAKAKGTYHLRNATNQARSLQIHADAFLQIKDVKISMSQLEVLTRAARSLKNLIALTD